MSHEAEAVAAGDLIAAELGELLVIAAGCGCAALVRRIQAAIGPARTPLLRDLRRAFCAMCSSADVERVDRVEADLVAFDALITACFDLDAETVRAGGLVDLVHVAVQSGAMEAPTKRSGPTWAKYVAELVRTGNDKALIEHATGEGFAGTASHLATLAGLTEESISRGRKEHRKQGFSTTTREWFRAYLVAPHAPPPPMATTPGPKARPGAAAPQVWMRPALQERFVAVAERLGGQRAVLDWLLRDYLDRHTDPQIPTPTVREGDAEIRTRIAPDLLAELDGRGGGPGARAAHLRAAIAESLSTLERKTLHVLPPLRSHAA